ncbi:carbohydrate ABC transporter permease [Chloroflexi bacterium TSY]|nr:carbohydrate ABC transporter permease [Chloroflexi bacterium TSY]
MLTNSTERKLRWYQSVSGQQSIGKLLLHCLLILFSVVFSIPLLWVISTSLKLQDRVFTYPIQWIPDPINWKNYERLFTLLEFSGIPGVVLFFQNTLVVSTLATVGTVISSVLVAYSFARLRWPERNFFFSLSLGTMMLPTVVIIIPTFLLFRDLGWLDTLRPLIWPFWFAIQGFYVFMANPKNKIYARRGGSKLGLHF